MSTSNRSTAQADLVQRITEGMGAFTREHAAEILRHYRPEVAAHFGERVAARVLDDPGVVDFVVTADEDDVTDPARVAYLIASHLSDSPDATIEQAYAGARARIARENRDAEE